MANSGQVRSQILHTAHFSGVTAQGIGYPLLLILDDISKIFWVQK